MPSPPAEDNGERRALNRFLKFAPHRSFADREQRLDDRPLAVLLRDGVLQVVQRVRHVPRVVGETVGEDLPLRGIVRVGEEVAVLGLNVEPAEQVGVDDGFGPAAATLQYGPIHAAAALEPEAAAVGQAALAECVDMAGAGQGRDGQELLDLVVSVGHLLLPVGDALEFRVGRLREFGQNLAHGALDVVGKRRQVVPRDVRGGNPPTLNRLFIEIGGAVGPHLVLAAQVVGQGRHSGDVRGAARSPGLVLPVLGDFPVDADVEVAQSQAVLALGDAGAPLAGMAHPFQPGRRDLDVRDRCGEILDAGRLGHALTSLRKGWDGRDQLSWAMRPGTGERPFSKRSPNPALITRCMYSLS